MKAIRAFERAGYSISRQSKQVIMSNGTRTIAIPRTNSIMSFTLVGIVKSTGMTVEQYRALL